MSFWSCSYFSYSQRTEEEFHEMLDAMFTQEVPLITVEELNADHSYLLLDTREKKEYEISHIKGARWVGYRNFDISNLQDVPKDSPIVLYCSVGYRSEKIGVKLIKAGFSNVSNLYGSIFEWVNKGYPVVDSSGNTTDRIHSYNKRWSQWVRNGKIVY